MSEERQSYHFYPIALHQGAIEGKIRDTMMDAIYYSIYKKSLTEEGTSEVGKVIAAANHLDIKIPSAEEVVRRGRIIHFREHIVMVSMSEKIMFDYLQNKKTEFELACFCAYAAIRSVLGKKPSIKMTNEFFVARMFGFASISDMPQQFKTRNIYKKYTKRYNLDRIKKELIDNWGMKYYARHTRGFFVSYNLSMESLVERAERERKVHKQKVKKAGDAAILAKVLAKLEAENHSKTTA